ncbi:MAG: DMT family transporter [Sphingobium sp.]
MDGYMLGAALMIASGSIHAIVNAIVKGGRDAVAGRALTDGTGAAILLPAIAFVPLPHGAWEWLAASAVLHSIYLYGLIRAYQIADFSAAYPILRGTAPLLTALVTVGLIGEPATPGQMAGIAVIGAAMFLMLIGRHVSHEALGWSVMTGAAIASYTVVDAHGVRAAPDPLSYIVWVFVLCGLAAVAMFSVVTRGALFSLAARQWKPGAIAGAMSILSYGMALRAYTLGPTAPLAALRETGMVTAVILSALFLKERVAPTRIVGAGGIFMGAVLILTH